MHTVAVRDYFCVCNQQVGGQIKKLFSSDPYSLARLRLSPSDGAGTLYLLTIKE